MKFKTLHLFCLCCILISVILGFAWILYLILSPQWPMKAFYLSWELALANGIFIIVLFLALTKVYKMTLDKVKRIPDAPKMDLLMFGGFWGGFFAVFFWDMACMAYCNLYGISLPNQENWRLLIVSWMIYANYVSCFACYVTLRYYDKK